MKKLFALILTLVMIFTLAACGGKDDEKPAATSSKPTGSCQQQEQKTPDPVPKEDEGGKENNADDWTSNFSIAGLTTPDGFTVAFANFNGGIGDVKFGSVEFGKDDGFTDADVEAFAQMVWDCCEDMSSDGVYKTTRDSSGKAVKGEELADLAAAKSGDRYTWYYTEGDMIMSVNIELYDESTLIFETYQQ